jgi:hypothetical protein
LLCTTWTVAATALDVSVFFSAGAWLCERPKKFHLRGERARLTNFFGPETDTVLVGPLIVTVGSAEGSKMESSDMMLASKLVMDGDTT